MRQSLCLLLLAACKLDGGDKDACNVQTDCLVGFVCRDQMCVATPDGGGGVTLVDAPSSTFEYGTVMPLTPASSGLKAADYQALIGTTAAGSSLGCTMIRDEMSSPGTATSLVHAKIDRGYSGDTRCPDGNHAIVNNPDRCSDYFLGLNPGCALYKQWDASGKQIANRLAIGGYVAIADIRVTDMEHTCNVELNATFAGGTTIRSMYSFTYNPYAPESAFCTH